MATARQIINRSTINDIILKGTLIKAFEASGVSFTPTAAPAALTDSTGGTANDTLTAVGDTTTNQATAINNNLADLAAKINALRTALITSGVLT